VKPLYVIGQRYYC